MHRIIIHAPSIDMNTIAGKGTERKTIYQITVVYVWCVHGLQRIEGTTAQQNIYDNSDFDFIEIDCIFSKY